MGLIVTPNTNTIKVHGTPIELSSLYIRIEYTAHSDGRTMSVTFNTYYDRFHFDNGELILTDINHNSYTAEILPTEIQSIDTALNYGIIKFQEWGYSAVIE